MDLFKKAKGMVADATEKVAGLAESTKEAISAKVTFKVIDTKDASAGYLEMALGDLIAKNKTVEVTGAGSLCIVKLTN